MGQVTDHRSGCWTRWIAAAVLCIVTAAAHGQGRGTDALWVTPEGVVAYWAFDGAALGKGAERDRALVAAGLRGLIGNVVPIRGGSMAGPALLRAEVMGAAPYRVCLLKLKGSVDDARPGKPTAMEPEEFAAVVEVRAPASQHDRLSATIEAAMLADSREDGGKPRKRRELALPGGAKGQASGTGEAWREVSWVSLPDRFVAGFGEGALEQWLGAKAARGPEWVSHRAAVSRKRGRGTLVFEAYADLNALRQTIPDEFDGRALGRLLHAWRVANARSFMVHAALVPLNPPPDEDDKRASGPCLLAIDVSWSSRKEPPKTIDTATVTESTCPATLEGAPTGDSWAVVMRTGVPAWVEIGTATYSALSGGNEFEGVRTRWARRTGPMMERIVPRIGEWAVLRPDLGLTLTLRKADGQDRLPADLRALFSTLAPSVVSAGKGWDLAAPEAEGALRGLSWRLEESALVTEWKDKP